MESTNSFFVSAPGKVIVHGEHSVVYERSAIAAAIDLRSYLLVETSKSTSPKLTLNFSDIALSHSWPLSSLPLDAFAGITSASTTLDPALAAAIEPAIALVSPTLPPDARRNHLAAAKCFLYLFLSLPPANIHNKYSYTYTLRSTLPIGAGLGSSASVSVCLATALLFQSAKLVVPSELESDAKSESQKQVALVNAWAFVGEVCIHGTPSGVDNTVSSGGKAVVFKRTANGAEVTVLRSFPELPLLLVNTRQPRSTSALVERVRELRDKYPRVVEPLLDAMDGVCACARELLTSPKFNIANDVAKLGDLFALNHGLLSALGVSHPRLERARELVDSAHGWAKLTGAGGGGCAIALLDPNATPESRARLVDELEAGSFQIFHTHLGGSGVAIALPESQSTDVKSSFISAPDGTALENIVGVHAATSALNWMFWQ